MIKLSVVMPTYNDGLYLRQAMDSILGQTYRDFEFVIVNDGSTDDSESIINSYSDNRIRYLKLEKNSGNTIARNAGMELAKGEYIAIMDSDDIAVSTRLALQIQYLDKNKDIGILGGSKIFFDEKAWFYRYYPRQSDFIKSYLFFKNAMGQPTIMFRREILEKYKLSYIAENENSEDFDLWYRAAMAGVNLANLKEVLLYYRQSESQMSHPDNLGKRPELVRSYFKNKLTLMGMILSDPDFDLFFDFINGRIEASESDFRLISEILNKIREENMVKKIFDPISFKAVLFSHMLRLNKYFFLEKGRYYEFFKASLVLLFNTGLVAFYKFWYNEGRYFGHYGINKIYFSPLKFK